MNNILSKGLTLFLLIIYISSCIDTEKQNKSNGIISNIETNTVAITYFPDEINRGSNKWFSEQLLGLKEPSLYEYNNQEIEAYRMTILPTFENPLSIRFEINSKDKKKIHFYSKSHSGAGGYSPKKELITIDTKKIILEHNYTDLCTWDTLTNKLEMLDFWNQNIDSTHGAKDGTEYVLEGYKNGRYYVIHRSRPSSINSFDKAKEFIDLVIFMLNYGEGEYRWRREMLEKILKK